MFFNLFHGSSKDTSSHESSKDEASREPFLDVDEEPQSLAWKNTRTQSHHRGSQIVSLIATALISTAVTAAVFMFVFPHTNTHFRPTSSVVNDQILDCGTTAEEARMKGCVFDIMHYSWTPVPCYNRTLSEQYWRGLLDDGIEFWNDHLKTHTLSHEDILSGKYEYSWTSWRLHLNHCKYIIHRELQQLTYGTPVDSVTRNISHTEHCLKEIQRPEDVNTMLLTGVAYLKCAQGTGDIGPAYWNEPPARIEPL